MNWAWAASLDQLWRQPIFAMWLTLAVAGCFGVVAVIAMVRADKSFANAALTIIALMAVGMVTAASFREVAPAGSAVSTASTMNTAVPALSCIDDLAGDTVLAACERALFGSAESAAAAVSYAATQITRLTAVGDVATANRNMTLELHTLRRSVERDRYGLMAQVLLARDHCSPSDCAAFRALTDNRQIVANMDQRVYEGLISRYAPLWTSPVPSGTAAPVAMLSSSMPTGKPTNAEFPSAASTPAVSIMSSEPAPAGAASTAARAAAPAPSSSANAPLPSPRPAAATPPAQAAPKKPAAAKQTTAGPVQLAPPPAASAPETSND
jgi:hypothetical protein